MTHTLTKQDLEKLLTQYTFYSDGSLRSDVANELDAIIAVLRHVNFSDKFVEPTKDDFAVVAELLRDLREHYMHLAEDTLAEHAYRQHRYGNAT
jgi:predicted Zn-dependent peptidase